VKEYKRLTNNNLEEYNPEYDFCVGCKYFGEPNGCNRPNGTCGNYERFIETYNRLAELEDKIENGTLIELPCKVGDKVYYIEKGLIYELKVNGFKGYPTNNYIYAYMDRTFFCRELNFNELNENWFLTKAEAEAKLKELKEV
jgi:hypothetical protein